MMFNKKTVMNFGLLKKDDIKFQIFSHDHCNNRSLDFGLLELSLSKVFIKYYLVMYGLYNLLLHVIKS